MLDILKVTFPFFALVLCGYLAARVRLMPLDAIGGLNTFVLYFALPCMLYRFGAGLPIGRLFDPVVIAMWLPCALLMVAASVWFGLNERVRWNDASFGALVAAFPNSGFMGVPLLVALLGAAAAGPVIATMLIDMVLTTSLCIALSRLDEAGGARLALRRALRGMLVNPLPWAILLGGFSSAFALRPLQPVAATIALLGDAASPVALFTIGAVLARSQMRASQEGSAMPPMRDVLPMAVAKLLMHPVLVLGAGLLVRALGMPLDDLALAAVVLVAALPSASNVSMLAERYGADTGRIALIILVTTAVSFFTFSLAVHLLR